MSEFLEDPSVLTKDKLKSALVANNVALPNGDQRKGVYVELYLKNLTSQNRRSAAPDAFSSDEELPAPVVSNRSRSGRKATRKTDRVPPEELDVTELTNEGLKDQLLKYGVNAGPIVASTRKLYEKKLQKLLDQGPPETVIQLPEPTITGNSQNGNTDSDHYSDKEEETITAIPEPEPEPEPVPVVERPLRSRGKTPVTTRTRSGQHKQLVDEEEEDFQVLNVQRKSRRTSRRVDQTVPASDDTDFSELSAAEMLPAPRETARARPLSVPKDPKPLLADRSSSLSYVTKSSLNESPRYSVTSTYTALYDLEKDISTEKHRDMGHLSVKTGSPRYTQSSTWQNGKKLGERGTASTAALSEEAGVSLLDTALIEGLSQEPKSVLLAKHAKRSVHPRPASAQPSVDLIHMMCRLSPPVASPAKVSLPPRSVVDSPCHSAPEAPQPVTMYSSKEDCSGPSAALLRGKQTKLRTFLSPVTPVREPDGSFGDKGSPMIEKLSAVEQTPRTPDKDVLKELFPNETLNTPTGISATRRQPIKGAAGRPFSDSWRDDLRPRLTEIRHTSSSTYTENRSINRTNAVPLNSIPLSAVPKPAAPPAVQAKTRRRLPVWVQLLLLSAVAGFLFFVYQAMETNEMNPFGQSASSNALGSTSK